MSAIGIIGTIAFVVAGFISAQFSADDAPPGYRAPQLFAGAICVLAVLFSILGYG